MAPVLMACWGIGRLLGPQLMVAGGGHPTNQWFGMYYAGQIGKRLPVPIFQSMEDLSIFATLLLVERWLRSAAPVAAAPTEGGAPLPRRLPPAGIVLGTGMVLWGTARFLDEHLWLGEDGHLGSILTQIASIALAVAGVILLISRIGPFRRWRDGKGGDLAPVSDTDVTGPDSLEEDGVEEEGGDTVGVGDATVAGPAQGAGELQGAENGPVVSAGAGASVPGGTVRAPGRAPVPGDLP
jgi:hypothetical protein